MSCTCQPSKSSTPAGVHYRIKELRLFGMSLADGPAVDLPLGSCSHCVLSNTFCLLTEAGQQRVVSRVRQSDKEIAAAQRGGGVTSCQPAA